ncbi:MAG: hypothetical protein LBQ60_08065 [Bacteroidales bacterium]|jgi:hypothetical protein|nr:hypothetical protein [Bacteroidales bacterium]
MKIYFLTIILFLAGGSTSFAQDVRVKDPDADKFIGTWKYDSADYSISITFTKGMFMGIEMLFGAYEVQKDGQIYKELDLNERLVMGGTLPNGNPNEIMVVLNDFKILHKHFKFTLTMQSGYKNRAILKLVFVKDTTLPEGKSRSEVNLLPPDGTVLIKQAKRKR